MKISLSLLVALILLVAPIASQGQYACDGGNNDILLVARLAYMSALSPDELENAIHLADQAVELCSESAVRADEAQRYRDLLSRAEEIYDLVNAGSLDQALILAERLFDAARSSGDGQFVGDALAFQGNIAYLRQDGSTAIDLYERAIEQYHQIANRTAESIFLQMIGLIYELDGNTDQANRYYSRANEIALQSSNDGARASALFSTGAIALDRGELERAVHDLGEAAEIFSRRGEYEFLIPVMQLLGVALTNLGDFDRAELVLTDAYQIASTRTMQQELGSLLSTFGQLYAKKTQFGLALNAYLDSLNLRRASGDRLGEAVTLDSLGVLYAQQGRYVLALDYHQQALELFDVLDEQRGILRTLNNMATVRLMTEYYNEAIADLDEALTLAQTLNESRIEATILANLGLAYLSQFELDEAIDYFERALELQRDLRDRRSQGATLLGLGLAYIASGDINGAAASLALVPSIAEDFYDESLLVSAANQLGILAEIVGDSNSATERYTTGAESADLILQASMSRPSLTSLFQIPDIQWPFQRLAVMAAEQGDYAQVFTQIERGRAYLLRAELTGSMSNIDLPEDAEIIQQERELREAIFAAEQLVTARNSEASSRASISQAQAQLADARQAYDTFREQLEVQDSLVLNQLSLAIPTIADVQALLPDDTTLVMYALGDNLRLPFTPSVVLIIRGSEVYAVTLEVTGTMVREQLRDFAADRQNGAERLQSLYAELIAPIEDYLPESGQVMVSPGSFLADLPFAALQAPDGSYLIDHYSLTMIPSATVFALMVNRSLDPAITSGVVLAQADPPGFSRLQNANREASAVAEILGVTPVLDAAESDLRELIVGSSVLHVAAHGEFDRFAPQYSRLVLRAGGGYDGLLEVHEVYGLDLRSAQLVVLSACETGIAGNGEDFGLLNRAFFAAGANHVVSSLWRVDDAATADLLTAFYAVRSRGDGLTESQALRAALLEMKANEGYANPYFWASFQIAGIP